MMKRMLPLLVIGGITFSCLTCGYYDTNPRPAVRSKQERAGRPDAKMPHPDTEAVAVFEDSHSSSADLPEVIGSVLYHLVSQGYFSVESLSCCFD